MPSLDRREKGAETIVSIPESTARKAVGWVGQDRSSLITHGKRKQEKNMGGMVYREYQFKNRSMDIQ
jgi:hypothetical protein